MKVVTGSSWTHHIVTFSYEAQSLASSSANAYFFSLHSYEKNRQCTYNVTLSRVLATIVAVEKQ